MKVIDIVRCNHVLITYEPWGWTRMPCAQIQCCSASAYSCRSQSAVREGAAADAVVGMLACLVGRLSLGEGAPIAMPVADLPCSCTCATSATPAWSSSSLLVRLFMPSAMAGAPSIEPVLESGITSTLPTRSTPSLRSSMKRPKEVEPTQHTEATMKSRAAPSSWPSP